MHSRLMSWACVAVAASFMPARVAAQHENHIMRANRITAAVLDGSKTPELIPDEAAAHMFILGLAAPDNGTTAQDLRIRAALMRSGLGESDIRTVKSRIMAVHDQIRNLVEGIETIRQRLGPNPPVGARQDLVNQHKQIRALTLATYNGTLASLSIEGAEKLREHIQYVKTRIKIIPPPPM
jgi:hypothetical protein